MKFYDNEKYVKYFTRYVHVYETNFFFFFLSKYDFFRFIFAIIY